VQQPSAQSAQTAPRNLSSGFARAARAPDALEAGIDSARGFLERADLLREIPKKVLDR
jgi:hypothetical protein